MSHRRVSWLLALAAINIVMLLAVAAAASVTDRASCRRTAGTRQSVLALRDYAVSATRARRETGLAEAYSNPTASRIDLRAAKEFQSEADRVVVKQNTCDGLFP